MSDNANIKYTCRQCGKEFESPSYHVFYCMECRAKKRAEVAHNWYAKNRPASVTYDRVCPVCGKAFTTTRARQIYDTTTCYQKHYFQEHIKTTKRKRTPGKQNIDEEISKLLTSAKQTSDVPSDNELIKLALEEYIKNHTQKNSPEQP